ncbi:MAG: hypothetical protein DMD35_21695 [Gemmatimonadetes bacterium]|nr:MAG: hypothetical protein DMD35_21695 [Gemmatimonadota bacterium]
MTADQEAPTLTDAATESERNRLLRRADWRYLLPSAETRRVLCLAGGELRAACAIVGSHVDEAIVPGESYDLVVAENPDADMLRAMAGAVRPGGACYTEWTRLWPRGAAGVRRTLEHAGFRAPRTYQPWPSPSLCRAWVPTEGDAARHYWRSAFRGTRVRRERLRALIGALRARLHAPDRVSAVAVGPAADPRPELLRLAHEADVSSATPSSPPRDASLLLLTHGERAVGKVVALVFDGGVAPSLAIKTARTRDSGRGLHREAEALDAVAALHPRGMAGVPRVRFHHALHGRPVIGESALVGTPIAALLTARAYPRLAERVTEWLCALAQPALAEPRETAWETLYAPTLDRFATEFAPVLDPAALMRAREMIQGLGALPVVCEQRDCSPWNVFEGPEGIVVLDWESAEPRGLPAMDLVYFATHAAFYLERAWNTGRFESAYAAAWSRDTPIGRANHECAERYFDRLEVDVALLRPIRLFAWMLHAHSDWVHLRDDAGGPPPPDLLATSRFLRLFNAELAG